jgi:hypothetical protein
MVEAPGIEPGAIRETCLLLSPALRKKVEHVDVFRKGFYSPRK